MTRGDGRHAISALLSAIILLALTGMPQTAGARQTQTASEQQKATHYSLYYEEFKNGNFEAALPSLRWILNNAPLFPRNDARNFYRLQVTYDTLTTLATDPALKRAYADSTLQVFDRAVNSVKSLGGTIDEFEWIVNKGRFIQKHQDLLKDLQPSVPDLYRKAYVLDASRLPDYYLQVLVQDYISKNVVTETLAFIEELETRFPDRLELKKYTDLVRSRLTRTPADRITVLETQRQKNPRDPVLLHQLLDLYRLTSNRLKMREIGETLIGVAPDAATYRLLALLHLGSGDYRDAIADYQALIETEDSAATADDHYNLGLAFTHTGQLQAARRQFLEAIERAPKYGRAYIGIGDLYATAVAECGTFERDDRAVYWLAVDYYDRARDVDPSVADLARQKIETYQRSFPNPEMLFFKGWRAGQPVRIDYGCYAWINESTTVKNP